MPKPIIKEDEVTAERLLQLFQRAFLKAEIEADGDVYVTSGVDVPFWVSVDTTGGCSSTSPS